MAKYGPLYTYWSRDWEVDYVEFIRNCAKAGANCTEIHTHRLANWPKRYRDDFRKLCRDEGVEVAQWTGFTPETNILSADPAVRKLAVAETIKNIRLTSELGSTMLDGTYVQTWNTDIVGRTREETLDTSVACLKEMARVAEEEGVTLGMEILNRFEGALINTMDEALEVLRRVDSPNLKITADIFHMNIEEDGIRPAVLAGGSNIAHFHLGEANRKLPGKGSQINWDELFGALRDVNYDGMFIFEAFVLAGGNISPDVHLWRDLSGGATEEEMTAQLSESIAFVKGKFEK